MELSKSQTCPHCGYEEDDSQAEWDEGVHQVDCYSCKKTYYVSPQYKFLGFGVEKPCEGCGEQEGNCECEDHNPTESA